MHEDVEMASKALKCKFHGQKVGVAYLREWMKNVWVPILEYI